MYVEIFFTIELYMEELTYYVLEAIGVSNTDVSAA